MNMIAFVVAAAFGTSTFTIVDSMEECRAMQQVALEGAIKDGAIATTENNGVISIVAEDYNTYVLLCTEQHQSL